MRNEPISLFFFPFFFFIFVQNNQGDAESRKESSREETFYLRRSLSSLSTVSDGPVLDIQINEVSTPNGSDVEDSMAFFDPKSNKSLVLGNLLSFKGVFARGLEALLQVFLKK